MKRDLKTGRIMATHGFRYKPIYRVFNSMVDRCCNLRSGKWKDYGGRGIFICKEWLEDRTKFFAWAETSGYRPSLQIDRRDNDGPYSPENCRWVTGRINSQNRRNTRLDMNDARVIRELASLSTPQKLIAALYGVKYWVVSDIKRDVHWREC